MYGSKNLEVEIRMAPFTTIPNNSLEKHLFPIFSQSWGWWVGGTGTQRRKAVTWELSCDSDEVDAETTPVYLGLHMPLNQWTKKGVTELSGVINPGY